MEFKLPVVNLMRRIQFSDWLSLSSEEQTSRANSLQLSRLDAIAAARQVKVGTKSAAKNKAKTSAGRKSTKTDQDKLAKLLAQMTPEQIAAMKKNLDL